MTLMKFGLLETADIVIVNMDNVQAIVRDVGTGGSEIILGDDVRVYVREPLEEIERMVWRCTE